MNNELLHVIKTTIPQYQYLYNSLVLLDDSYFDMKERNIFFMTLYSLIDGPEKLTSEVLNNIRKNIDKIDQKRIEVFNQFNNALDSVSRDWISVAEKDTPASDIYAKLYLSVDNSSIHKFANKFIQKCIEKDYHEYDFKINKKEDLNRRDNIVVYCKKDNLKENIELIQEVIKENPDIKFNKPHLLAAKYDEHIYCGVDFDKGKTSYTERLTNKILEGLQEGKSPEALVLGVSYVQDAVLERINKNINNRNKSK